MVVAMELIVETGRPRMFNSLTQSTWSQTLEACVPAILRRTLVVLLALRAVAAPVVSRPAPSTLSHHQFLVVRMRCWPYQQLGRFSSSSKLLRLYSGKNRVPSSDEQGLLEHPPLHPASQTILTPLVSRALASLTTARLSVCRRC